MRGRERSARPPGGAGQRRVLGPAYGTLEDVIAGDVHVGRLIARVGSSLHTIVIHVSGWSLFFLF
jgi:hypothetical protein